MTDDKEKRAEDLFEDLPEQADEKEAEANAVEADVPSKDQAPSKDATPSKDESEGSDALIGRIGGAVPSSSSSTRSVSTAGLNGLSR